MKHPPREGDLPREELMKRATEVTTSGPWRGADILFKFTCEHCGERCTLEEPNQLFEFGECFACGKKTKIEYGGFTIHMVLGPKSITCPKCGRTSNHPMDIKEKYCGHCHRWHEDMKGNNDNS